MRRQTGFALDSFFIRKFQVIDVFFEETDWLGSPGRITWGGDTEQTDGNRDYRKNWPKGRFLENVVLTSACLSIG